MFAKNWAGGCAYYFNQPQCGGTPKTQGKQATFNSIHADGSQKKQIKSYGDQYVETRIAEFGEIYILFVESGKNKVDEYHSDKIETISQDDKGDFYNETYPYYSVSPSGNKTLWSKHIDGKNTFFVGNDNGENGQEIARSDEYAVYGWFSDEYVLFTKKGSEMYIMPVSGAAGGGTTTKITDYYKPEYNNRGFGYGG